MTLILAFTDIITHIPTLIIVILNGTLVIDILKEKLYNIAITSTAFSVHEPYLFCNPLPFYFTSDIGRIVDISIVCHEENKTETLHT